MDPPNNNVNNPDEPDFEGPLFQAERQELVEAGLTAVLAVASLRAIHRATKEKERVARDRARQEQLIARAEETERAEQLRRQQEEDEAQALREERKKNKAKFAPIPNRPVPVEPSEIPAQVALRKLRAHQFVELWYWTNDGLDAADRVKANVSDDSSLSLITSDEGTPTFVPSTSTHSKLSVVADEDLTFEQFGQAALRMIRAMRYCNWDPEHVQMFVYFWRSIEQHPWRYSRIVRQQKALLIYQGQQRLNWHKTIGTLDAFTLAEINETTLLNTLNDFKDSADEQQSKVIRKFLSPVRNHHNTNNQPLPCEPLPYQIIYFTKLRPLVISPNATHASLRTRTRQIHYPCHCPAHIHFPSIPGTPASVPCIRTCHDPTEEIADRYSKLSEQLNALVAASQSAQNPVHSRLGNLPKRPISPSCPPPDYLSKKQRTFRAATRDFVAYVLAICAICLGRHKHNVNTCVASRTWDNKHDTYAYRKGPGIFTKKDNRQLCAAWQRPDGCTMQHHPLHNCSGCGSPNHGAHRCPRAQDPLPGNPIQS